MSDLSNRVKETICRGIIGATQDTGGIQTSQVQLLADEAQDNVERIQQYGFSSVPMPGSECVVIFVGGNRDHPLMISTDNRGDRHGNLKPGETVLYSHKGDYILISNDKIEIEAHDRPVVVHTSQTVTVKAETKVMIDTPECEVSGHLTVRKGLNITGSNGGRSAEITGDLHTTGDVVAGNISLDTHTHSGVQTGSGSTGGPK